MRESRLSGSVEGVVCKHDSYSDSFLASLFAANERRYVEPRVFILLFATAHQEMM
jgi:hypothetical protein